jgi:hypothetical protein
VVTESISDMLEYVELIPDTNEYCDMNEDSISIELISVLKEDVDMLENVIPAEMASDEDTDSDAHAVSVLVAITLSVTRLSAVEVEGSVDNESTGIVAEGLDATDKEVPIMLELAIEHGIPARILS